MILKELKILSDGRIGYSYSSVSKTNADSFDDFSSKCSEAPKESFDIALKNLIPIFLDVCEIDQNDINLYTFKQIKFTRTGDEQVLGFHITCLKRLKVSLVDIQITSPLKFCDRANDSTKSYQIVDQIQKETIYKALRECELFAQGERLQITAAI